MALPTRRLTRRALDVALNDWSPSRYANPPQSMVDECDFLQLAPRETYQVEQGVTFKNKDMRIYANGAWVINDIFLPDTPVFFGDNDYTNMQVISAITNTSINQGGSSNQNCVMIEVPDASGYAAGDTIRIGSDDKHTSSNPSDNERIGEPATVYSVDTGTTPNRIYTKSPLREVYTTNPRVWRMAFERRCEILNLNMDCVRGGPSTANSPMLKIRGYKNGFLQNVRGLYSYSEMVRLEGCMGFRTFGVRCENQQTSTTLYRTGYTMVDYSGHQNSHFGLYGSNVRHVFTTGVVGSSSAGADAAWSFGRTSFFYVNGHGFNCHHAAFDSHPDGYHGTFDGCIVEWDARGVTGSQHGIGLRGIGHRVTNCKVRGGNGGISIGCDYDHADNCRDHLIDGFEYIADEGNQGTAIAIDVSGNVDADKIPLAGRPTGIVFRNINLVGAATTSNLIAVTNAEVTIAGGKIKAKTAGTSGSGRIYEINSGADLTVERVTTDFSGVTASGVRMAISRDDSLGNVAPPKMKYEDCKHKGGDKIQYLLDAKSDAGEFTVDNLETDVAPTGSTTSGVTTYVKDGGSLTVQAIDFKVKKGRGGNRSSLPAAAHTFASGAQTLNLQDCSGDIVRAVVKTTGAGVSLTDVTGTGLKDGMTLIVVNDPTSTNTFTIPVGGNWNHGTTTTVAIGKEVRFSYSAATKFTGG